MLVSYKKIMATLDGSEFAAQAVPHAYTLAKHLQADLILFRVVPFAGNTSAPLDTDLLEDIDLLALERKQQESMEEAIAYLPHIRDQLHPDDTVRMVAELGQPGHRIVTYAREHQVDLIVMTTHGRTGLRRLMHGSVAEDVLQLAPCPIYLLRST
jgi:nucleotide-binding universal stress UspA family protein